jgi:hypothetical protein
MAAARQKEMNVNITVVATNTLTAGRFKPSDDGDDMRFKLTEARAQSSRTGSGHRRQAAIEFRKG